MTRCICTSFSKWDIKLETSVQRGKSSRWTSLSSHCIPWKGKSADSIKAACLRLPGHVSGHHYSPTTTALHLEVFYLLPDDTWATMDPEETQEWTQGENSQQKPEDKRLEGSFHVYWQHTKGIHSSQQGKENWLLRFFKDLVCEIPLISPSFSPYFLIFS